MQHPIYVYIYRERAIDCLQWTTNQLDLSTVLVMFWAEELYNFTESVGNALTMLQTNSTLDKGVEIGLEAMPIEIIRNVEVVPFNSSFILRGQPVEGRIEFVNFRGSRFGVGKIGESKEVFEHRQGGLYTVSSVGAHALLFCHCHYIYWNMFKH